MYNPSLKEFLRLTKKGNVIPVYREIKAGLDTPLSSLLKIKKGNYAFLLESVEGRRKLARYSFLGSEPSLVFRCKGKRIQIDYPGKKQARRFSAEAGVLEEIKKIMRGYLAVAVKGLPRFYGGLVGYIGYDAVRFFENIPDKNPDDLGLADCVLMLTDSILIFDHLKHSVKIVNNVILPRGKAKLRPPDKTRLYRRAIKKIESIYRDFRKTPGAKERETKARLKAAISSNFTKKEFMDRVNKAKAYIKQGDIIQVVLSQRFTLKTAKPPFDIYRALRSLNPSPYMYFLELKNIKIIGSSPEMLVRCEEGIMQTRPIAGTRPRGNSGEEDRRLEKELLHDEKEKAEHLMLVGLGRNDLGRVAQTGSIVLSEFMGIEKYSHVMHLVSEVRGKLDKKRFDIYDVLRAAFPAGTVSGSPKIRAMQIIDELENVRRGPYAGCVGYFSFSHNLDTCITIRTILIRGQTAYIQAGAGIVADSVPAREYQETVNKAKALVEAIVK